MKIVAFFLVSAVISGSILSCIEDCQDFRNPKKCIAKCKSDRDSDTEDSGQDDWQDWLKSVEKKYKKEDDDDFDDLFNEYKSNKFAKYDRYSNDRLRFLVDRPTGKSYQRLFEEADEDQAMLYKFLNQLKSESLASFSTSALPTSM